MTAFLLVFSLIALLVGGMPIGIAISLVAAGTMWVAVGPDLLPIFIQRFYSGTTTFTLLAIPFFIIAGNIMNLGGMTTRIFDLAQVFVGRVRGGLAHVNVISSTLFSGMSGSAVADAAGLGLIEVKAMKDAGYTAKYAAAITAVSSTIGPIIPPSIPFLIYASLANVSVGALFIAGLMPGLLMAGGLMIAIALAARRKGLPKFERHLGFRESLRIIANALPALAMPVLVLGGLLLGFATATETAVLAAAYAFLIGTLFYRELSLRQIPQILWISCRQTVQVMFIMAAAAPFGWVLVQQRIPNEIISGIVGLSVDPWMIILLINVTILVLGMFIEGAAVLVISVPILLPIAAVIGIEPVHLGVILVLNIMIGLVTPPVGLVLFTVAAVANVKVKDILDEAWPYILALMVVLIIISFSPGLVNWLPSKMGFN
ncbi:MAG: TRAP transporter large permease [Celeribacter sp.]|jgi:tripartite ATP-independent transporter DctM subunit